MPLNERGAARRSHVFLRGKVDMLQCLGERDDAIGADRQTQSPKRAGQRDQVVRRSATQEGLKAWA